MQNSEQKNRYFKDEIFTSENNPFIQIKIDPSFTYLGNTEFDLKGIAHVDRHIFAEAEGLNIKRMIILQFEGFLENNDRTYNFQLDNPINLGGELYGHNNYFFSMDSEIKDFPKAESDYTMKLLESHGFRVEDEQMTSRFARIVYPSRRHEFILFYHENIRNTGHTLATIANNDIIKEEFKAVAEELTKRSLQSFNILEH